MARIRNTPITISNSRGNSNSSGNIVIITVSVKEKTIVLLQ